MTIQALGSFLNQQCMTVLAYLKDSFSAVWLEVNLFMSFSLTEIPFILFIYLFVLFPSGCLTSRTSPLLSKSKRPRRKFWSACKRRSAIFSRHVPTLSDDTHVNATNSCDVCTMVEAFCGVFQFIIHFGFYFVTHKLNISFLVFARKFVFSRFDVFLFVCWLLVHECTVYDEAKRDRNSRNWNSMFTHEMRWSWNNLKFTLWCWFWFGFISCH
jgi:hypothetical protein